MPDDETPIPLPKLREVLGKEIWPYSAPRTYQLARDVGDGRPVLATIRVGKRRLLTTKRAVAEFFAARTSTTPRESVPLTPEQREQRRKAREANKAAKVAK